MKNKTLIKRIKNAQKALHNVQTTIYNILSDYEDKNYISQENQNDMGSSGLLIDESIDKLEDVLRSFKK